MTENKFEIFSSAEFGSVRTLETTDGKVLFCGADVAKALGYKDTRHAITAHCKGGVKYPVLTNGGNQETTFITEGDMYRLVTHSKRPDAERFETWVFDEVLPTIRKHGAYMTENTLEKALTSPDFLIQLATTLKEEQAKRKALETTVAVQEQQISELQPKASYYDVVLNSSGLISTSTIAKDYGKTAIWLNKFLHEKGVQFKQGDIWLLYQKYAQNGYTSTKTHTLNRPDGFQHTKVHTYWTQKGRLFIYDLLKTDGILPVIERKKEAV
ncbi:MAG: phage antirepressor KilAC domain-containing protein [Ruminococcus sp.]|nr:phage antirepressor KilAC domain-containing protein [Ruminococcus sp.]MDE7226297.1 phage antirepressor KilAC domain-containing protein [Ruminococcus sp.]